MGRKLESANDALANAVSHHSNAQCEHGCPDGIRVSGQGAYVCDAAKKS